MRRDPKRSGFTLIELLAVVVIILILAGIVLGLVKFAQDKAARSKAEGEISAISTALESYKTDNGTYPKDSTSTPAAAVGPDALNAQKDTDLTSDNLTKYKKAGAVLYMALTGDPGGLNNGVFGKTYYNVPPSMMSSDTAPANGTSAKYLVDPFGNPYGYSTIYDYALSAANAQTPPGNPPTDQGYNPTFDLWSTAGYVPSLKNYPSNVTNKSTLWIKNW